MIPLFSFKSLFFLVMQAYFKKKKKHLEIFLLWFYFFIVNFLIHLALSSQCYIQNILFFFPN